MPEFRLETRGPASHVIYLDNVKEGWEQWFLLSSDRHHDSTLCNREAEKQHLELAVQRDALIIDVGDFFDAMQGFYDPRKSYSELRPEYKAVNYLDALVADAAKFFSPYSANFAVLAQGNHETNLVRRLGTNLTERLVHELNRSGGQAQAGGYTGYIRIILTINQTKRQSVVVKYHHGLGGNAPVTRGVIDSNRMAVMFPDADVILSGHNHESWLLPIQQERLTKSGVVTTKPQWHVRIPSYKDAWGQAVSGFDIEKGSPKPVGCVWMRLYARSVRSNNIGIELSQTLV